MNRHLCLLAAAVLASAGPAHAQEADDARWRVEPYLGFHTVMTYNGPGGDRTNGSDQGSIVRGGLIGGVHLRRHLTGRLWAASDLGTARVRQNDDAFVRRSEVWATAGLGLDLLRGERTTLGVGLQAGVLSQHGRGAPNPRPGAGRADTHLFRKLLVPEVTLTRSLSRRAYLSLGLRTVPQGFTAEDSPPPGALRLGFGLRW